MITAGDKPLVSCRVGGERMDEYMTEAEQKAAYIEEFTKLQRIKAAPDRDEEINYQIKTVKAKLESMGVNVEDLTK